MKLFALNQPSTNNKQSRTILHIAILHYSTIVLKTQKRQSNMNELRSPCNNFSIKLYNSIKLFYDVLNLIIPIRIKLYNYIKLFYHVLNLINTYVMRHNGVSVIF